VKENEELLRSSDKKINNFLISPLQVNSSITYVWHKTNFRNSTTLASKLLSCWPDFV